ncbi:hypothetical protein IWT25_00918 [Secundilactobacillus pentosiphilus]|uniref:Uncharacterized protein n=1 Tax=Secundilactobacillus pentosiphilus TaxID=1714682 RepID=A0A1Z5IUY3_9LACO|nr:hypothetical protein [Secundilactobacillus pentosiphilus]GAX05594.1 hypothetical protein IWT25_00918 [Secundilactobacillus pentosiphilus]
MNRTITILIGVAIAVGLYLLIHHVIVRRNTKKAQSTALEQTNVAVKAALQRLADEHFISAPATILDANIILDGWGRGVMAFEYLVLIDQVTDEQLPILRQRLNHILAEFCQDHQIPSAVASGESAFLVTDAWRHTKRIHLGVAYLVNEATIEYIQDLHRLDPKAKGQP